ncbi:hypothetical protein [Streptomyces sp. AB3(2024)]|uniref:SCO3933 family regulatory protein n=1 Tax=Streptomyces sp. AB3(2024) TaxID=3317321 RepID=UPI0035A3A4C2
MPMPRIRVAMQKTAVCIAGTEPVLKIKDQQTGEVATDRETGESLYTVTVMLMEDGRAEIMKITVPQSGLVAGLKPGAMVRPVDLFATPWARIFNGQLSDGIAYRAARLELIVAEAAQ